MSDLIPPLDDKFRSFLIFGPPGAGKGTIGKMLCQAGNMVHVSSGDIFRGLGPRTPAGKLVRQYLDQGQLVPDDVTIAVWRHYVEGLVATNRYNPDEQYLLLDGIPRTVPQAKELKRHLDLEGIILLEVKDQDELIRRLQRRASIEGRSDDASVEILERRFAIYQEQTTALLDIYPKEKVYRFNAQQTIPCVLRDVLGGVADRLVFIPQSSNV